MRVLPRVPIADGWEEFTDFDSEIPKRVPLTLVRSDVQAGVFQVSMLAHTAGRKPSVDLLELADLLTKHLEACGLSAGRVITTSSPRASAMATCEESERFCRAWLILEDGHFVLATYVVAPDDPRRADELEECEAMVAGTTVADDD